MSDTWRFLNELQPHCIRFVLLRDSVDDEHCSDERASRKHEEAPGWVALVATGAAACTERLAETRTDSWAKWPVDRKTAFGHAGRAPNSCVSRSSYPHCSAVGRRLPNPRSAALHRQIAGTLTQAPDRAPLDGIWRECAERTVDRYLETAPEMSSKERHIGLFGATNIGVGAIVGGGILVLAGAAFSATGPSAVLAFALNGVIALLTALSFADMSTAFPESGGTYVFAKRVMSVRAAFATGWVLWFAYIVAGVLYSLGFATYALALIEGAWPGEAPAWLGTRTPVLGLAFLITAYYAALLIRRTGGAGHWATWGKVAVFAIVLAAGAWAMLTDSDATDRRKLVPFFPEGGLGLFQAMGYTFIALQGFEIIAAVAGEVKSPSRNLPRSMLLSLAAALAIYIPLILVVTLAGTPVATSIQELALEKPDTVMAVAVGHFMGGSGYWLIVVAAILSTMSALQANVLAASRVALTMARDRTLPAVLSTLHPSRKTPTMAVYTSALAIFAILLMVPDLSAAGAAASLIFLVSFALAHGTNILAHRRSTERPPGAFVTPWFPLVPIVGGCACLGLAVFQAFAVPAAGGVSAVWLGLGVVLYMALFSPRAAVVDATAEAKDPRLARLRGHAPLILVPVANPANAPGLVSIAGALAPPRAGKVLLMTVVQESSDADLIDVAVDQAQEVLSRAMKSSIAAGHRPEGLLAVAPAPWKEIARVAKEHGCAGLLLGRSVLDESTVSRLDELMNSVDCDIAFFRATSDWRTSQIRRILVPVGGRSVHSEMRARLLASLCRDGEGTVVLLRVLEADASEAAVAQARRALQQLADDTAAQRTEVVVERAADFVSCVASHAENCDLMVVGLQRDSSGRRVFGDMAPRLVASTNCASVVIQSAR